ncbi:MAG: glycolate oxidase subunit GlcE [Gammaproteobacteria bacterium]|nr:glycolate oxidase subunit GlcE [Gammaproteobacteria bacterium]
MTSHTEAVEQVCATVQTAYERGTPLEIVGSGSRRHWGREPIGEPLVLASYRGIVAYEPSEYVITVRAGTPIADIEAAVAAHGQTLAAELPRGAGPSTIGGAVALGLTGPSRPYAGSLRDAILGARIVTGTGQLLRFGGQVLKNVAGFDVSRLMVGAYGTLGVLMEVSLRLHPQPEESAVCVLACDWATARSRLLGWTGRLPLTGACYYEGRLHVRLGGRAAAIGRAVQEIGGETGSADTFFALRDLRLDALGVPPAALWRLLVPPAAPLDPPASVVDWGGAQRFWATQEPAGVVHALAARLGGQAVRLAGADRQEDVWAAPAPATMALYGRVKAVLDPRHILNRGRLSARW